MPTPFFKPWGEHITFHKLLKHKTLQIDVCQTYPVIYSRRMDSGRLRNIFCNGQRRW